MSAASADMDREVAVQVRMSPALHEALKQTAQKDDRSLSATIRHACTRYVEQAGFSA